LFDVPAKSLRLEAEEGNLTEGAQRFEEGFAKIAVTKKPDSDGGSA
jgi:hypothetical protein